MSPGVRSKLLLIGLTSLRERYGLADAILQSLEKMQLNGLRTFAILRPGLVSMSPDGRGGVPGRCTISRGNRPGSSDGHL